jgi:hypothetical protein
MATFNFTADNLAKLNDYLNIKQPATVIKQTPPAGTPVLEGMTIEVQTVSLSDVPVFILDPQAPAAIKNLPVADVSAIFEADDTLIDAAKSGNVTDPIIFAQKLNSGLSGRGITTTISATDAAAIAKSVSGFGFLSR